MSLRRQAALFVTALQFLTRLPAPALAAFDPAWVTRSARYFPLVGQIVGALAGLAFLGAAQVWPPAVAALLAIAVGLLATGGLHEDGLADTADGLFGGATPGQRLEIMKDSRIGAYGLLALVIALGLKATTLAAFTPMTGAMALVAAHGLGRAMTVVALRVTVYAPAGRPTRWTPAARGVSTGELIVSLALAAWPLCLLPPWVAVGGAVGAAAGAAVVILLAKSRLGGHTGDVLGAVEQMGEVGFLLGASAALACA